MRQARVDAVCYPADQRQAIAGDRLRGKQRMIKAPFLNPYHHHHRHLLLAAVLVAAASASAQTPPPGAPVPERDATRRDASNQRIEHIEVIHPDDIARFAGAGTLVPITGFANSVVSPALEFKTEGFVLGTAAKMFVIAGPVIVFGIGSSVVYGLILVLVGAA